MNPESDVPGSIRWAPDVFGEAPATTKSTTATWLWGALAASTLAIVLYLFFTPGPSSNRSLNAFGDAGVGPDPIWPVQPIGQRGLRRHHHPIRAVTGLSITTAQDMGSRIRDQDFVIGVEIDGAERAYAINMMGTPETELLNDTLHDQPTLASFCNQCQTALIFSRRVTHHTLTFFLSGELMDDNMVMEDVETGSKWSQLAGEAIEGPLTGEKLEQLAATWTDWKTWRESHPATTVPRLARSVENYQHHSLYSDFLPERSFFFKLQWGLAIRGKARSWPYARLSQRPVVNERFGGKALLIVFDRKTSTPTAFDRQVDGLDLTFQLCADGLTDDDTPSRWDPISGRAVSGPMKGRRLTPVAGTTSLESAWRKFFPASETWSGSNRETGG
jgi:hypothetical protein